MKIWVMEEATTPTNFIAWDNFNELTIMGKVDKPSSLEVGDIIKSNMHSGRVGCFMIDEIKFHNTYFFEAQLIEVGYEDEVTDDVVATCYRVCREATREVTEG